MSETELVGRVLAGDAKAVSRAISQVEDLRGDALAPQRELLAELCQRTPEAHLVVGLTGPPGSGKSTLAGALIRCWLGRGLGVGMIAVDPSSRRSGGALLGDRARLRFGPEENVFVRSMAARERLGGLAPATRAASVVLRAAYPVTLVETVGVGQSEVDVESVADLVLLVLQPGSGDTLQFMKAGILEIPDLVVVHKWDLGAAAEQTRRELEATLALSSGRSKDSASPPVIGVSARSGEGIAELVAALDSARGRLEQSGALAERRANGRAAWALELLVARYGTIALERLGGRERVLALARELPGTALDAFAELVQRADLE